MHDPLLKDVANPSKQMEAKVSNTENFLSRFPILVPNGCSVDKVLEQFSAYQMADISNCQPDPEDRKAVHSVDKVWAEVEKKHPHLKDLCQVMRGILTIPPSSAACERIFSVIRKLHRVEGLHAAGHC